MDREPVEPAFQPHLLHPDRHGVAVDHPALAQQEDPGAIVALDQVRRQPHVGPEQRVFQDPNRALVHPVAARFRAQAQKRLGEGGGVLDIQPPRQRPDGQGRRDAVAHVLGGVQHLLQRRAAGDHVEVGGGADPDTLRVHPDSPDARLAPHGDGLRGAFHRDNDAGRDRGRGLVAADGAVDQDLGPREGRRDRHLVLGQAADQSLGRRNRGERHGGATDQGRARLRRPGRLGRVLARRRQRQQRSKNRRCDPCAHVQPAASEKMSSGRSTRSSASRPQTASTRSASSTRNCSARRRAPQ